MLGMNLAILVDGRRILKNFNQNVRYIAESQFVLHFFMIVMMVFFPTFFLFFHFSLRIFDFLFFSFLLDLKKHLRVINFVANNRDVVLVKLLKEYKSSFLKGFNAGTNEYE